MRDFRKACVAACIAALVAVGACGGADGTSGTAGKDGTNGAAGEAGAQGPSGSGEGGSVAPTAGAVFPNVGFLERELDVQVMGDATHFDPATTVSFGAGITVSNIHVESPTALGMHLVIAKDATLGSRDVTITAGGAPLTSTGAFDVQPELTIATFPAAQQGGLLGLDLQNHDVDHPFLPQIGLQALPGCFPNLNRVSAAPTDAENLYFIEPSAAPGPFQVVAGQETPGFLPDGGNFPPLAFYSAPGAFSIAPRTPIALTPGTLRTGDTLDDSGQQTQLYSMTSSGQGIVTFVVRPGTATYLDALLFPASGKMVDLRDSPPFANLTATGDAVVGDIAIAGTTSFLDVFQSGHGGTFDVIPTFTSVASTTPDSTTAHYATDTAQTITLPAIITGTIDVDTDAGTDCFKITTTAVSQKITFTLEPSVSNVVAAFGFNGTNCGINFGSDPIASVAIPPPSKLSDGLPVHESTLVFQAGAIGDYYFSVQTGIGGAYMVALH